MIVKYKNEAIHKISDVKETIAVFMLNSIECSNLNI